MDGWRKFIGLSVAIVILASLSTASMWAFATDLTLREIVTDLRNADPSRPLDLSRKDLSFLDLGELDFKRANLAEADLLGANLIGAKLAFAKLTGAKLDRTSLARADFTGADLAKVTMFDAVGSASFDLPAANAPIFRGTNLAGARIFARLSRSDFRGADLSGANLGTERNQFKMPKQTDLSGALFDGARLERANLTGANMIFASLAGANLRAAILVGVDLSNADLSGAELAGADLTDANIYGTIFKNAKAIEDIKGLDRARNRDRAIFR